MGQPVDLTYLRELTGGDKEVEGRLFELFITSCEDAIKTLEANCTDGENAAWRKQAHALKGSSVNIGANALAGLCSKAQDLFTAPSNDKQAVLSSIKSQFQETKAFLKGITK